MIILCNFFPPGGFKLVADSLIEQKHLLVRGVIDKFNDIVKTVDKFLKCFSGLVGHQRVGLQFFKMFFKTGSQIIVIDLEDGIGTKQISIAFDDGDDLVQQMDKTNDLERDAFVIPLQSFNRGIHAGTLFEIENQQFESILQIERI